VVSALDRQVAQPQVQVVAAVARLAQVARTVPAARALRQRHLPQVSVNRSERELRAPSAVIRVQAGRHKDQKTAGVKQAAAEKPVVKVPPLPGPPVPDPPALDQAAYLFARGEWRKQLFIRREEQLAKKSAEINAKANSGI
jgi:hypothetical protein